MRRMLFDIAALIVCRLFDIYERIKDIYAVRLMRRHLSVHRDTIRVALAPDNAERIAIVAIYPSTHSLGFVHNALDGLVANGFYVVVVSNRRLDGHHYEAVSGKAHRLIERAAVGRDFGSYQAGLRALGVGGAGMPVECELLALLNDSMFYRHDSAALFANILSLKGDWISMFENYEFSYHAQSFFMAFRWSAFRSAAFVDYWRDYVPYSSRHYTINAGEVGFSASMRKAGFLVSAYYNSTRLSELLFNLLARRQSLTAAVDMLPLHGDNRLLPPDLQDESERRPELSPQEGSFGGLGREFDALLIRRQALTLAGWTRVLWQIVAQAEKANPTHFTGLLLNNMDLAPLKRDVCYRGTFGIAQVVRQTDGISEPLRAALECDLRSKGLPASITGVKKLLFHRGRV